jgi:hypothetical protein
MVLGTQHARRGAGRFEGIAARYKAAQARISDMLGRGDRDYGTLTALSRELGQIRMTVRQDLVCTGRTSKA